MKTLKIAGYTLSCKIKFKGENTGDCEILNICEDTLNIIRVNLDKIKFDETTINL